MLNFQLRAYFLGKQLVVRIRWKLRGDLLGGLCALEQGDDDVVFVRWLRGFGELLSGESTTPSSEVQRFARALPSWFSGMGWSWASGR